MIKLSGKYIDNITALKKKELDQIVKDYQKLAKFNNNSEVANLTKAKKKDIIKYLNDHLANYLEYTIRQLSSKYFDALKVLDDNNFNVNDDFLVDNRLLINTLIDKKFIIIKDEINIPKEVANLIKEIIKKDNVKKTIKENDNLLILANGIIVAYGVIDKTYFSKIIVRYEELKNIITDDFIVNDKMVCSSKLTNKEKINTYLMLKNYKEFSLDEYKLLGMQTYHHNMKSYKKLIRMLKNNYVFKKNDIMYVDKNIVIPYLYNSLQEESEANQKLVETILRLFEFKSDKLKNKMLEYIKTIRNDFPIWEYRGYSKNEVK